MTANDLPAAAGTPSDEALELLALLHEQQHASGWKGTTQRAVPIADVKKIFFRMPRIPNNGKELPNRALSDYLRQLSDAGHVKSSSRTDGERVPLPLSIRLTPIRSAGKHIPPMPLWHSKLAWAEEYWALPHTTDKIRAAYEALNAWLHRGHEGMRVPLRERALKVFGHHRFFQQPKHPAEKVLDTLKAKPLFSDRTWLLRLINAFEVDPPLLTKEFRSTQLEEDSGYHRLGKGRTLLVVENSTTYWSISHALGHIDHRIGYVAWGIGRTFQKSIGSITPKSQITDIVYFGDLDVSGLSIPLGAGQHTRAGLPPIRPATELYDALFRLGTPGRCPPKETNVTPARAQELASWLHPRHRGPACALMLRGERLAQEWVSFDHLSTDERWQADVR
ncbi:Wadjet anti-phage system protein JetD domain-containing protein [Streptomyces eurythermus]|uniref:Wadjet anti-phage system protein JetD domain-containing protein n=1 Tax=Streptomyces eurythermus TaxID=42237 RepID=UPI00368A6A4A